MDVLGLPLHALHPGHASVGRAGPAGHPAALAALLAPAAAAGPAGWVGGGGRDAFVRFHRGRYGQHQQRPTHGPLGTTNLRAGWDGTVGSVRLRPVVGFKNVSNRAYARPAVIKGS